jgi:putative peptidoglycan lipid II flippase
MSRPAKGSLLRSAAVVSAAVSLSRITGMVREMVMARLFGAGQVYDAFLLGVRIPNLTRNLFAEGALSSAFIPAFTQHLKEGKREAQELSDVVATLLLLAVGAACLLGIVFTPQLVGILAPGFAGVPGKFELAVRLTRIMFPFLLLVALAAHAMGLLNACDRFGVPALASAWFNVASVVFGLAFGFVLHHSLIESMAWGVLAGGLVQLVWQLPSVGRAGFGFRPRFNFRHPGVRRIARLMLPAFIGSSALQINLVVNTNLASRLTDASGHVLNGPVSWLNYAFRFLQLPLGVFGAAIASATLPRISRSAAGREIEEFRSTLAHAIGTSLLLAVPSSVGLALLGESMIAVIYQGGRFQAFDTHQTAVALACYSVGLAAYSLTKILAPAFYALDDGRTPMLVSIASVAVNAAAAFALVRWAGLGHAGLALSVSVVALLSAAALFAVLRQRIGGLGGARLASSTLRIAAASALMGTVCAAAAAALPTPVSRFAHALRLAVVVPLGVAVFYAAARALRVPELEALRAACYTPNSNAPRLEVGDPPARN